MRGNLLDICPQSPLNVERDGEIYVCKQSFDVVFHRDTGTRMTEDGITTHYIYIHVECTRYFDNIPRYSFV